ncbi:MAG TPA: hypothetical protein VJS42_03615 [Steroidobacteraceae bacterium]|nr:hypothetical protein [Steroidobacteraceae bacterium]
MQRSCYYFTGINTTTNFADEGKGGKHLVSTHPQTFDRSRL